MDVGARLLAVPERPWPTRAILRRLGYPAGVAVPDGEAGRLYAQCRDEATRLFKPQAICRVLPIDAVHPDRVILTGVDWTVESAQVATLLSGCRYAVVLAVTVGPGVDDRLQRLGDENRLTEAVFLDAMGSEVADDVADWTHHEAWKAHAALAGFTETPRYSPGYGDWPLEAQTGLLEVLGASAIGIVLEPSLLMRPSKSVSAIFGLKRSPAYE